MLLKTGMRTFGIPVFCGRRGPPGPGSRRRRNAERMTVSPQDPTIGYLAQKPDRRPDETVRQFLVSRS